MSKQTYQSQFIQLRALGIMLLSVFCFLVIPSTAQAKSTTFSVTPIFPENQRDTALGYFDLRVTPDAQQEVTFEVKNVTGEPVQVATEVRSGVTTSNGELAYQKLTDPSVTSASLTHPFDQLAQMEPIIDLAPHETKNVPLTIHVPAEPFDGEIIGSVHFTAIEADSDTEATAGQASLQTRLAFQFGVVLSENDNPVPAELSALEVSVNPNDLRNPISVQLENTSPVILSDMTLVTKIYQGDSKTPLFETTDKEKRMAPNSYYAYPVPVSKPELEAGHYRLELTVTAKQGEWSFTREFEISEAQAQSYQKAIDNLPDYHSDYKKWLWIGGGILLLIAIGVGGGYWWWAKKKKGPSKARVQVKRKQRKPAATPEGKPSKKAKKK